MRIAVTGASGYIGREVVRLLTDHGHHVLAFSRQQASSKLAHNPLVTALVTESGLPDAGQLSRCDAVIHLAGRAHTKIATSDEGKDLFEEANFHVAMATANAAIEAGVNRFVFVSTIGVHGNWSQVPLTENSDLNADTPYGHSKIRAEQALNSLFLDAPERLIIVRPPMVFGHNCPGNFPRLVRLVGSGIPLPFCSVKGVRSFIHVQNLANFLIHCTNPGVPSGTYVIGDGSDFSLPGLIRKIAQTIGVKTRLFPFPLGVLRMLASLVKHERELNSLTRPMPVDWSRARDLAKWLPPLSPEAALKDALHSHDIHP